MGPDPAMRWGSHRMGIPHRHPMRPCGLPHSPMVPSTRRRMTGPKVVLIVRHLRHAIWVIVVEQGQLHHL